MDYNIIIIGSGAAGLSAAIYAGRYNRSTLLIKGKDIGGTASNAGDIENYPGYMKIPGYELMAKMEEQATNLGAKIIEGEAVSLDYHQEMFSIKTDAESFKAPAVIFATGTKRRTLGLPNEESLTGKGVSYCATCDGPLFKNKTVAIVGGGDSSLKAAEIIRHFAKKVYLITVGKSFRCEPRNMGCLTDPSITVLSQTKVEKLLEKDGRLSGIILSKPVNGTNEISLDGLFVEIGGVPNTSLLDKLKPKTDTHGQIEVDWDMATNLPGLFAAGDVTNAFNGFKQIITAAAAGSTAASSAHNYLNQLSQKPQE